MTVKIPRRRVHREKRERERRGEYTDSREEYTKCVNLLSAKMLAQLSSKID